MPPRKTKTALRDSQVESSEEENGVSQMEETSTETVNKNPAEGTSFKASEEFEKWKLEQEYKLKE